MQHKISVDAMGGDFGPSVTVPASLKIFKNMKTFQLSLLATPAR